MRTALRNLRSSPLPHTPCSRRFGSETRKFFFYEMRLPPLLAPPPVRFPAADVAWVFVRRCRFFVWDLVLLRIVRSVPSVSMERPSNVIVSTGSPEVYLTGRGGGRGRIRKVVADED